MASNHGGEVHEIEADGTEVDQFNASSLVENLLSAL
jgi:hypothetical protein